MNPELLSQEALEDIGACDPKLADDLSRWSREVPTEEFFRRVDDVMSGLEDRRDWPGHEGDEANRTLSALNQSLFVEHAGH